MYVWRGLYKIKGSRRVRLVLAIRLHPVDLVPAPADDRVVVKVAVAGVGELLNGASVQAVQVVVGGGRGGGEGDAGVAVGVAVGVGVGGDGGGEVLECIAQEPLARAHLRDNGGWLDGDFVFASVRGRAGDDGAGAKGLVEALGFGSSRRCGLRGGGRVRRGVLRGCGVGAGRGRVGVVVCVVDLAGSVGVGVALCGVGDGGGDGGWEHVFGGGIGVGCGCAPGEEDDEKGELGGEHSSALWR
ncbi:hypothetical protein B0H11DRAFT_196708 [Mycena galericulata]|nr:hypothetical protein B0H11DRAFT_196708 [Mycena galericulata]